MSVATQAKKTANKALRLAKKNATVLSAVEWKRLKISFDNVGLSTTPVITNLTAIGEGDTASSRDGRKVGLKSIRLQGTLKAHASATTTLLRIMLFGYRNVDTTPPVIADLFGSTVDYYKGQMRSMQVGQNQKYWIIWDKVIVLDTDAGPAGTLVDFYLRFKKPLEVTFQGVNATDEGKNHIYLIHASDESTNVPTLYLDSLVRWIDM